VVELVDLVIEQDRSALDLGDPRSVVADVDGAESVVERVDADPAGGTDPSPRAASRSVR
jgi:hypothetical protein